MHGWHLCETRGRRSLVSSQEAIAPASIRPAHKAHSSTAKALRAASCAMREAGIDDGDILLVDRAITPAHGRIAIAVVASGGRPFCAFRHAGPSLTTPPLAISLHAARQVLCRSGPFYYSTIASTNSRASARRMGYLGLLHDGCSPGNSLANASARILVTTSTWH